MRTIIPREAAILVADRCDRHLKHGGLSDVARTPVAHMGLLEHEVSKTCDNKLGLSST